MSILLRGLLFALALAASWVPAQAQLSVNLSIKRTSYILHEPILATVAITNLSGRDLLLRDAESPWFGFHISPSGQEGQLVPPRNRDYQLDPLEIKTGETIKQTWNLNSLYAISEYGRHRVRAAIYVAELSKYFTSNAKVIDLTDGRILWQATVGVPETLANGGRQHTLSVLEHSIERHRYVYARVHDRESGTVFCTYQLGLLLDGHKPEMQLDIANNLYILHLAGLKTYLLSNVGINGEFFGQKRYVATKSRPMLRRLADGTLQIVGGQRELEPAPGKAEEPPAPKLSDRPVAIPKR